jgi:hypothetical protein
MLTDEIPSFCIATSAPLSGHRDVGGRYRLQPLRFVDVPAPQTCEGLNVMKSKVNFIALSMLCVLSACGTTPKERTTGGAAAGAATGAAVGALAGPPGMAVGALVGGGAGAATGAATSPQQVNLGKPPWTNPDARVPTPRRSVASAGSTRGDTSQNAEVDRLNAESLRAAQSGTTYR